MNEVPKYVKNLAELPIDSPYWKSAEGEEYMYISTGSKGEWLVTNEKVGPYRVRSICKVLDTIRKE